MWYIIIIIWRYLTCRLTCPENLNSDLILLRILIIVSMTTYLTDLRVASSSTTILALFLATTGLRSPTWLLVKQLFSRCLSSVWLKNKQGTITTLLCQNVQNTPGRGWNKQNTVTYMYSFRTLFIDNLEILPFMKETIKTPDMVAIAELYLHIYSAISNVIAC